MAAIFGLSMVFACATSHDGDVYYGLPQFAYEQVAAAYVQAGEDLNALQAHRLLVLHHSEWRLPEIDAALREARDLRELLGVAADAVGYFSLGKSSDETWFDVELRQSGLRFLAVRDLRDRLGDADFLAGRLPLPLGWR